MQETNFYVTPTLDRVSLNRRDDAWLAHRMAEPESRLLIYDTAGRRAEETAVAIRPAA